MNVKELIKSGMDEEGHAYQGVRHELLVLERLELGRAKMALTLLLPTKTKMQQIRALINKEWTNSETLDQPRRDAVRWCLRRLIISVKKSVGRIPNNGLAFFLCQDVCDPVSGKSGAVCHVVKLRQPVNKMALTSGPHFATDLLWLSLRTRDMTLGFVVIDGSRCLIATIGQGVKKIHSNKGYHLPNKHGRGGQSAPRFGRLREEARHNYLTIVIEKMTKTLLREDGQPLIEGLVLAGSGQLKEELVERLPPTFQKIILGVLTVAESGQPGLDEAADKALSLIDGLDQKKVQDCLGQVLDYARRQDLEMCSAGEKRVKEMVQDGVAETVLVWEKSPLVGWLQRQCPQHNTGLLILTNTTPDSRKFVGKLQGVAAIHRHPVVCRSTTQAHRCFNMQDYFSSQKNFLDTATKNPQKGKKN